MANKQFWKKNKVEGSVLLRNQPDRGGLVGYVIVLFPILGLLLLFYTIFQENRIWGYGIDAFRDLLTFMALTAFPGILCILTISKIYWELLGGETVYYSDSHIYIQQKKFLRKEDVIPWNCLVKVEPYDESLWLLLVPTEDPTVCLTYKKPNGKTRKIRFGCHLNPKQRKIVIDRIQELLVESCE